MGFHTQYLVKEQLGKGGFGVVYSAVRRSDGLEVAVKEVNKDERVVVGDNNMPLEVALMQQLQDVPPVEAQRGGEELDQWLSQGQPPPEVEHPPGHHPPLAPRQDHPWQPGDQEHQEHGTPLPSHGEEPSILLFVSIVNFVRLNYVYIFMLVIPLLRIKK